MAAPNPLASRIAYWGLLPFVLGTALIWLLADYGNGDAHTYATLCLATYAGVVLALLGGVHWGLAMRQSVPSPSPYVWGAVPPLVGGVAMVMPAYAGLVVQGAMFVGCYLADRRMYPGLGAGSWLTLRFRLSVLAALSCFLAAAGV